MANVCSSDCVGVCGNVCCVAAVVKDSGFLSPGVLKYTTHNLFNCTHIRTTVPPLDLWTDPAVFTVLLAIWMEKLAGGPKMEKSDSSPH